MSARWRSPVSCRPRREPAANRSTSGSRCARSSAHHRPSPSDRAGHRESVMDERLLRELTPAVIGVLVHRGVDFASAEDAVQEALIQAALNWPQQEPADPKGWLVTVAWRKFLD